MTTLVEEIMDLLLETISQVFTFKMIFMSLGGTAIGILFGALPGLGASSGMALLMPLTFFLHPAEAQVVLLGIYTGAIFGGSWAAILINVPGCAASLMTSLDGYPMARKGQARRALGLSATCSSIGGMFGIIVLICIAPLIASFALAFAAPEYATLALLGLSSMVLVSASSPIKGYIGVTLGLLISMVGMDPMVFVERFTFGNLDLNSGINYIIIIIGIFGIGEVFSQIFSPASAEGASITVQDKGSAWPSRSDWKLIGKNAAYPCMIGAGIGALPGAGATIAAVISYNRAMMASKNRESFGKGNPEGVIASETANNATIGGSLVPLLTLGIPGSTATAVLLGALMMNNITPGPMLFTDHLDLIYVIFSALILADFFMLIIGMLAAPYVSTILKLSMPLLMTIIVIISIFGTYSLQTSMLDVYIMVGAGFFGYVLKLLNISIGGFVLGLVLGPIIESNFRSALEMSLNGYMIFITRPISLITLLITLLLILSPLIKVFYKKYKLNKNAPASQTGSN